MEKKILITEVAFSKRWLDLALIGCVLFMAVIYMIISGNRSFNFDEFQVLYASAALERGKALYADRICSHFPLLNIIISFIVSLTGFQAITILLARYFVLLINLVGMIFIYRIGGLLWNKRTGLLAILLALCSIVFLKKGIEIRHDVFNMTFTIIGAYYGLRYLKENRFAFIFGSGVFLGLALASTQKALVWIIGLIFGISLYLLRKRSYDKLFKVNLTYLAIIPIPLIISLLYLIVINNDSLYHFFEYAIKNVLITFAPYTEQPYPFPYDRYDLFQELIFQNHLLYALSLGSILAIIILWFKTNTVRIVVAVWALIGILFYVTAKRPFFQTFLPSIPPLSILAAGLFFDIYNALKDFSIYKKIGLGLTAISLLFLWPLSLVSGQISQNSKMISQMENISFCLDNLEENDKVLCFTQNQIYFDPVIKMSRQGKRKAIWDYDAVFFEQRMISQQCKVIINDYRTRLLGKGIRDKIEENYLNIKVGDILIPGFKIAPEKSINKDIWIEGDYYSPTTLLEIDGKYIDNKVFHLRSREYRFRNTSARPIFLVYIFDKDKIRNRQDMLHEH